MTVNTGSISIKWSSRDGLYGVLLGSTQVEEILSFCAKKLGEETGGILVGKYSPDHKTAIVTNVSGPASDSKQGRTWFVRGVRGLQAWLDRVWSRGECYYLGEWHSHGTHEPVASHIDKEQMLNIAADARYSTPEPLLIIAGRSEGEFLLRIYIALKSGDFIELDRER